jgi:hypothetical protein
MARSAKKAKRAKAATKAKAAKKAKKAKPAKKAAKRPRVRLVRALTAQHEDQRYPVHGDPDHEIVCKWIDSEWQCRQVPTGGDWIA